MGAHGNAATSTAHARQLPPMRGEKSDHHHDARSRCYRAFDGLNGRVWASYVCSTCGGVMLAFAIGQNTNNVGGIDEVLPPQRSVAAAIPEPARRYLTQAQDSLHAPDGAVMLAASAIDAMLKVKNYSEGTLNERIKAAAED